MNKDILLIAGGLVAGLVIWLFKELISGQIKATKAGEPFDAKKLVNGITSVVRSDLWGKSISQELSIRTWLIRLAIVGVILGLVYGYGFFKGQTGKPVHFDLRGKEATIKLNEHYLKIEKDGTAKVLDAKGNVLKIIRAKDIPELEKQLRPYGFIFEPVAVVGVGASAVNTDFEAGAGFRYLKYFKWYADICATNKGIYPIGVSYKITDNSAVGVSIGTGYKLGERGLFERIIAKYTVKF